MDKQLRALTCGLPPLGIGGKRPLESRVLFFFGGRAAQNLFAKPEKAATMRAARRVGGKRRAAGRGEAGSMVVGGTCIDVTVWQ
jgi:hypothetical protein